MTARRTAQTWSQPTGSPDSGEPVFLVVGRLRRPHGVKGELILEVFTDFPERLAPGVKVYVGEAHRLHLLRSRRRHGEHLLVAFEGIDNPEEAGVLRNELVYVRSDEIPPLPAGDYYHHELIGLPVLTESDILLGRVTEILEAGPHDVLVVQKEEGGEILLPVIDAVVLKIDLERREVIVRLLPGLASTT